MHNDLDIDLNNLPDDVGQLKQLIMDLAAEARFLREQFNLAIHRRFAASSERHRYPGQGELFDEAEANADAAVDDDMIEPAVADPVSIPAHTRTRGRKPLPEHLPRVELIEEVPAEERFCAADGQPLHLIGEDVSEQLDIIPAQVRVIRTIRRKYGCRHCETGVVTAGEPLLIPKSIATPGLLAYVAVSKYADSLPLYRQERMFARLGIELGRATLANWMLRLGELLQPWVSLMRQALNAARVVHMDETTVQVLKEPGRAPPSKSYMWVSMSGAYDPAMVLYDYAPSRSSAVPLQLLADYRGYLVSDGYKGYSAVNSGNGITGVGCWAPVRRKFKDVVKVQGKAHRTGRADYALNEIRKLYAIETTLSDKPPAEKQRLRLERAEPVLIGLRAWLDKSLPLVPPRTALGKALAYTDSEWPRLVRYLEHGELPIDNNRCENAIRPFVVGRKNWLFANSQAGTHASAAIYSMIETAKHNGLEPYQYLRDLLSLLPTTPADELDVLLPYNLGGPDAIEH